MKTQKNETSKNKSNTVEKSISFIGFLKQKEQLYDFAIIFGCCLLGYFVIRYFYPYPLTFSDSGGYIDAAMKDMFYVYRLFGYSYFLQIIHSITANVHSIFIIQLFLFLLATCFLAFTIKYFYAPAKKWLWYFSLLFLIFTPTSFIMANWIMSDLLFSAQVYFLVVMFIFIIKRKSWIAAILFILLLFTTLHVRYSAMVFPFVIIPFLLMIKGMLRWIITVMTVLVFYIFYTQVKTSMKESVKIDQFSTGFDGWNYANNVLHTLPHIDLKTEKLKSPRLQELHNFILENIDTVKKAINDKPVITANLMWKNNLPLKKYLFITMQKQKTPYLTTFVRLGNGLYKDYAIYIMTHYPFAFLQYYFLPNCKQTFFPAEGCLIAADHEKPKVMYEYYQIDKKNAMQTKSDYLKNPFYHATIKILHLIMWVSLAGIGIAAIAKRKKLGFSRDDKVVFWGLFSFAVIYYASSIFAAPMEIRYLICMHSIQFVFLYLLLNKLFAINKNQNKLTT